MLFQIGSLAFSFLVPALAGYIAFAIADRPGIAPGFTAGAVAVFVGAGFIGGLVGGLIAGVVALYIGRIAVPQWLRGLMPVVIIPLFATLVVGALMFIVLGRPLAAITSGLTDWLNGLSGSSAIFLGIILGLMMCFDLGGPVNKAAYAFAVAGLNVNDPATLRIMAAVMAAGMVPPLAMALASTVLRPKLFSEAERENGKAAWLLGSAFISEGAIPFAAADPAPRDPLDDGGRRGHRRADHGFRRHSQRPARRDLRLLRSRRNRLVPGLARRGNRGSCARRRRSQGVLPQGAVRCRTRPRNRARCGMIDSRQHCSHHLSHQICPNTP